MLNNQEKISIAGCHACQQGIYGVGQQPVKIAVRPDGPTFLYRCEICGTYWNYTINHAYPISLTQAQETYPFAFETI